MTAEKRKLFFYRAGFSLTSVSAKVGEVTLFKTPVSVVL